MPASAVRSPVPVTSTRSDAGPFTVPAMTRSPGFFSTGRDSPVIIDSLTALRALAHHAVGRDTRARADEHQVALAQRGRAAPPRPARPSASRHVRRCSAGAWPARASAPCAWVIERISIQWPSSMIVTSVASSSQSGMPGIAERHGQR